MTDWIQFRHVSSDFCRFLKSLLDNRLIHVIEISRNRIIRALRSLGFTERDIDEILSSCKDCFTVSSGDSGIIITVRYHVVAETTLYSILSALNSGVFCKTLPFPEIYFTTIAYVKNNIDTLYDMYCEGVCGYN